VSSDEPEEFRYGHAGMSSGDLKELAEKQGAPVDYEGLVHDWTERIGMLARRYGFRGEEIEDVRGLIILQFFEGQYLNIYDPRMAVFSTFMYNFIQKRLLQQLSKKKRDPVANYVPLVGSASSEDSSGELFDEMLDIGARRVEDTVESVQIIREIRERLADLPQRGKRNLVALFDMVLLDWPRSEIAKELSVSEATVCLMMKDLRDTDAIKLLRWQ